MQRTLFANYWWNKLLPVTLLLAGMGLIAIALAADLLKFGGPEGIGPRQFSLALSGLAVFLAGAILISPARQRYIGEWLLLVREQAYRSDQLAVATERGKDEAADALKQVAREALSRGVG